MNRAPIQYIFLDESGKPEIYSSKGVNLVETGVASKFLVFAAVRTTDHLGLLQSVLACKSELLSDPALQRVFSPAYSLDAFHANADYPEVRTAFLRLICALDVKIDVIVVEKLKCFPSLRENPGKLYGVMAGQLLKNLCHQAERTDVIFSRKDSRLKLRQELETEVERVRLSFMEQHPNLNATLQLQYQHNPHYSHAGLQVADYVAYSVFKFYEQGDRQWYDLIKGKIGGIYDICNRKYFSQSNPL